MQPISAITGSAITPENGSKVAADVLTRAAALLSQLSAISETATLNGLRRGLLGALHYGLLFSLFQLYRLMYGRLYRLVHKKLCQ